MKFCLDQQNYNSSTIAYFTKKNKPSIKSLSYLGQECKWINYRVKN